ncbi:hypothetical protein HMPREF9371_1435 [Neisseria shayeganii 871]|uniref:Uncharacterized protein n=1 Tax=Neisseria shayeganii 871 TaxID=1032488 RepID=G4CIJ6_9NEIS|nr:hypothetical protein HMPREF9371_1435 [Neisseria shayeganii 871]
MGKKHRPQRKSCGFLTFLALPAQSACYSESVFPPAGTSAKP